LSTFKLL